MAGDRLDVGRWARRAMVATGTLALVGMVMAPAAVAEETTAHLPAAAGAINGSAVRNGAAVMATGSDPTDVTVALSPGERLAGGQSYTAPSGSFELIMETGGDLVEQTSAGSVIWDTKTAAPGAFTVMQNDGNLVVYSAAGAPLWASGTGDFAGAELTLAGTGQLAITSNGVPVWAAGPWEMIPGDVLASGHVLWSPSHQTELAMQGDGNLVEYSAAGTPLWASNTGSPGSFAVMQTDGNLVVYDGVGRALWASDTGGFDGAYLTVTDAGQLSVDWDWVEGDQVLLLWEAPTDIPPGTVLRAGQVRWSPSQAFELVMQSDGNLVEYRADGLAVWASGTGSPGSYAVMQGDGNLVVYNASGGALWASGTGGHRGAYLSLNDLGQLAIDAPTGVGLWAGPGELVPGAVLWPGKVLSSPSRTYALVMQSDGNLVEYDAAGTAVWASQTGRPGSFAVMQSDGNFVIYNAAGGAVWATDTGGHPGAYLSLDDDGTLFMTAVTGAPLYD